MMFITLEGPDGSGKTSQMPRITALLEEKGYEVLCTREPGGTSISEQIRDVIHSLENTAMRPNTETLLYQAARAQVVGEVIRPALAEGKIVLCDRYADSTLAYQGYGHQQDIESLRSLIDYATNGLVPDLTLLFDVSAEEGLRRRENSGEEWNRLDAYKLEFHNRVREGYHQLRTVDPDRWAVIDASKTPDEVFEQVRAVLNERIATKV